MTTGERLKELRIEKKLSQNEFAEQLNVSRTTYVLIEQGKREVSIKILEHLKKEFAVSSDWVLFGDIKNSESKDNDILSTLFKTELRLKTLRPYIEELTIISRIKALEPQTAQHIQDQKFSNLVTSIYSNALNKFEEIVNTSLLVEFDLNSIEDTLEKISLNTEVIYNIFYKELEPFIKKRKTDIITEYWETVKEKEETKTESLFAFAPGTFDY